MNALHQHVFLDGRIQIEPRPEFTDSNWILEKNKTTTGRLCPPNLCALTQHFMFFDIERFQVLLFMVSSGR